MLSFLGGAFTAIALLIGYIISYHIVMAAAPAYITCWWISLILAVCGGLFSGLAKHYDKD